LRQFSPPHLAALAVMLVSASLAIWLPRRHGGRWEVPAARAFALLILAAWAGEYIADAAEGIWSAKYNLPLQLTDAVTLVAILALWTRRAAFVELVYFWGLTAALGATVTPDLGYDFPNALYFTFFLYHVGAVVAACYLVFGAGLVPRRGAIWKVYAATYAWAALAGIGCLLTGGNYMFLRERPEQGSLLSALGPWPWYLVAIAVIGLGMLFLLDFIARAVQPRAPAPPVRPRAPAEPGSRAI
jgi:hypothetical integral membrane protein (TIGR02206 family)